LLWHAEVVGVVHEPAPLHTDAAVRTPFAQFGPVHVADDPGYAQAVASVPLHVPRQASVVPAHAARVPRGVPLTATHLPSEPASAHAWHCPLHAPSQHTPSTQLPFVHSAAVTHCVPFAFFARQTAVASQYWPLAHGCVVSQPPEHFVASAHRLLAHGELIVVVHVPIPPHTDAVVAVPFAHEAAVQVTSAPGYWQRIGSMPLHCPLQAAVPSHAVRIPCGVPITATHLPSVLVSLQLSHWPLHAPSQHTPSAQWPDAQSPSPEHTWPFGFVPPSVAGRPSPASGCLSGAASGTWLAMFSSGLASTIIGPRPRCQHIPSLAQAYPSGHCLSGSAAQACVPSGGSFR
jgi:hypothetical protein